MTSKAVGESTNCEKKLNRITHHRFPCLPEEGKNLYGLKEIISLSKKRLTTRDYRLKNAPIAIGTKNQ